MAESDRIAGGLVAAASPPTDDQAPLDEREVEALSELMAVIAEREPQSALSIDKAKMIDAYRFAGHLHRDQRRRSGEEFISHPVSVATICAGLGLDTETLAAALSKTPPRRSIRLSSASELKSLRSSTASRNLTHSHSSRVTKPRLRTTARWSSRWPPTFA